VFVPEESVDAFIDAAKEAVSKMFPTLRDNPDYTSVINARHFSACTDISTRPAPQGSN
jgi:coniferyl-aldehyde dehydrogenase